MPSESPAERKSTRGRRHSGGGCQASTHRAPQSRPAPGIAAQWRVQADETPVTSAVWHDGQRQLTPTDTVRHPPPPRSGWRVNASRPAGWLSRSFRPPRVVLNKAEISPTPRPRGGLSRGSLERGGVRPRIEGPRRATLERGGDFVFGQRGLRGAESWCWPWAKRVLGSPCLKRLRASEFGKDPARVLYYVLRVF